MAPTAGAAIRRTAALALLAPACGMPGLPDLPEPGREVTRVATTGPATAGGAAEVPPGEVGVDCFRRHLEEAISLNERRRPTYAAWSDGASRPVSDRLIRAERYARLAAWYVDRRARRFQEAGIPVACAEFVSMSLAAPLPTARPAPPAEPYAPGPTAAAVRTTLTGAYGHGGFPAVADTADALLGRLATAPHYDCMLRHMVESIWRVAWLAPQHREAARRADLPTPASISELLFRLHLVALPDAVRLDRSAGPLQQAGIPILCHDVPALRHVPAG